MLLWLLGCESPPFVPDCLASGELHTCLANGPRACNQMLVIGGLRVDFDPPASGDYEASVVVDGVDEIAFRCDGGEPSEGAFLCDESGFLSGAHGDVLEITVTPDGGAPTTTRATPCWDVSEPNGRCCGFFYSATVTVSPV